MAERGDFGPTGYQLPAVVLLGRALEHLPVLHAVAVCVDCRISSQVVVVANSPCFLAPATVPSHVSAREASCTLLEHGRDELEAVRVAPGGQIHVKRRGYHDDVVAAGAVPFDALEGLRPDLARKGCLCVRPASLENAGRPLSSKRQAGGNLPSTARGHGSQSVSDGHRQQKRTRGSQPQWRDSELHERRPRVRRCDRAVEVEKGEVHRERAAGSMERTARLYCLPVQGVTHDLAGRIRRCCPSGSRTAG